MDIQNKNLEERNMACFIVPAAEAVVVSIINAKQKKAKLADPSNPESFDSKASATSPAKSEKISWKTKLSWLSVMLWGGAFLLAIEHIWHGEVTFLPPFLTALDSYASTITMLQEMATSGIAMALIVTLVWGAIVVLVDCVPMAKKIALGKVSNEESLK
jgi:hypothetical protein